MSVHFNPERPHVHSVASAQGARPVISTQRRHSFGDSLEIRSKDNTSWLDCIKNCFQAIWDFILRLFSKKPQAPEINKPVQEPNPAVQALVPEPHQAITFNDVDNIVVQREEIEPGKHQVQVFLKNGRGHTELTLHGQEIWSLVSSYAKDRINISNNPENPWGPQGVLDHFRRYEPKIGEIPEPPVAVLNRIFAGVVIKPPVVDTVQGIAADAIVDPNRVLTLNDVDNIVIDSGCAESWPCQHRNELWLKDGRRTVLNSYEIWPIISGMAKDRINISNNPNNPWGPDAVINHFHAYSVPRMGWQVETAEAVLNRVFARREA